MARYHNNPLIAIVVVTWNKKNDVMSLLQSLSAIDYDNYDIIVVDNASSDGTAPEIKLYYPAVHLIVNTENLGGTGGFNAGMAYALEKGLYKYIWLLDNDASVEKDTLLQLVKVADEDNSIGIAGSIILNPDKKDMIVELGSYVCWERCTWRPHLRNSSVTDAMPDLVNVDYVAACSALVRCDALRETGIMDERFFLHWDDVDLCLRINKAGYNVVAVSKSKIYHGVEKGFNPVLIYYDVRNGFLMISKHTRNVKKLVYLWRMLRGITRGFFYWFFSELNDNGKILLYAVRDFLAARFYKINLGEASKFVIETRINPLLVNEIFQVPSPRVLILPNGNVKEISDLVATLKKSQSKTEITLLIQSDRKNLFSDLKIDSFVVFDSFKESMFETLSLLTRLFFSRYDLVMSPSMSLLPFSYVSTTYYLYDSVTRSFFRNKENIFNAWKLPFIVVFGELFSILLLPFMYFASLKYEKYNSGE